jgi:uncharacterized protein (TIGR00369 family)
MATAPVVVFRIREMRPIDGGELIGERVGPRPASAYVVPVPSTAAPDHFVPWDHPSPVLDALGGFLRHDTDPLRIGFTVDGSKVNARGLLHAGVLATIADVSIGHALAASTEPRTPLLTISLTCDYTGSASTGSWVEATVEPGRVGRRLAAGSAVFAVDGRTICTCRGLFLPA